MLTVYSWSLKYIVYSIYSWSLKYKNYFFCVNSNTIKLVGNQSVSLISKLRIRGMPEMLMII